jgi:hypothetical protein
MATLTYNASVSAFQAILATLALFTRHGRHVPAWAAINSGITLDPPFRHHVF